MTTEVTPELELESFAPDEESLDEAEVDETAPPSDEEQPDPLADLSARLAAIDQRTTGLDLNDVRAQLGRVAKMQSTLDRIATADPLERVNPAISALQEQLDEVIGLLADSPLFGEQAGSLKERRAQKQSDGRIEALQREIEAIKANPPALETEAPAVDPEHSILNTQLLGYAKARRVELATLGDELNFLPGETARQAYDRIEALIDSTADGDTAASRLAARQQAAGRGSPARSAGVAISDMTDADSAYAEGRITGAKYREYREQFGIGSAPGGGR